MTTTNYKAFRGSKGWYVARTSDAKIEGHMTERTAKKAAVESNRFNPFNFKTRRF